MNVQPVSSGTEETESRSRRSGRQVGDHRPRSPQAVEEARSSPEPQQGLADNDGRISVVVEPDPDHRAPTNLLALNAPSKPRVPAKPAGLAVVALRGQEPRPPDRRATTKSAADRQA